MAEQPVYVGGKLIGYTSDGKTYRPAAATESTPVQQPAVPTTKQSPIERDWDKLSAIQPKGSPLMPPLIPFGIIANSLGGGAQVVDQSIREGKSVKDAAIEGGEAAASMYGIGKVAGWAANKLADKIPNALNKILGVESKQIRVGMGKPASEAAANPGRTLAENRVRIGELARKSPDGRAKFIGKMWDAAGAKVDNIIAHATTTPLRVDPTNNLLKVLSKTADPQLQAKAINAVRQTANDIGIQNVNQMTAAEARQLREALKTSANFVKDDFKSMPSLKAKLSGAVGGAMNEQIPGLAGPNQAYADLTQAVIAARKQVQGTAAGKTSSTARKVIGGAAILGAGVAAGKYGGSAVNTIKSYLP